MTEAELRERALAYLARYATTRQGLIRALDRRAGPEGSAAVRAVVDGLVAKGLVDDAAFARLRAERLVREGRSRMAVAAHLAARGVDSATARVVLPEDDFGAALVLTRKRRIGPFRTGDGDAKRELGVLARAGFSQAVAERALGMEREAAEDAIRALRGP